MAFPSASHRKRFISDCFLAEDRFNLIERYASPPPDDDNTASDDDETSIDSIAQALVFAPPSIVYASNKRALKTTTSQQRRRFSASFAALRFVDDTPSDAEQQRVSDMQQRHRAPPTSSKARSAADWQRIQQLLPTTAPSEDLFAPRHDAMTTQGHQKSLLATLIKDDQLRVGRNPFQHYYRFDALSCEKLLLLPALRHLQVFVYAHRSEIDHEPESIRLHFASDCRVCDVIGLVCWHYWQRGCKPALRSHNVERYALYMVDDDCSGGVDLGFPPFERSDRIEKYNFDSMALVECE